MKPIVLMRGDDGKVNMTIDEFKKYIDDAYEAGREDGRRERGYYWNTITTPYYTTSDKDRVTITCNNSAPSTATSGSNITL